MSMGLGNFRYLVLSVEGGGLWWLAGIIGVFSFLASGLWRAAFLF